VPASMPRGKRAAAVAPAEEEEAVSVRPSRRAKQVAPFSAGPAPPPKELHAKARAGELEAEAGVEASASKPARASRAKRAAPEEVAEAPKRASRARN
jgi:hypothetical protein